MPPAPWLVLGLCSSVFAGGGLGCRATPSTSDPELPPECSGPREDVRLSPVDCGADCRGFRLEVARCEGARWVRTRPLEPSCACAPSTTPAGLAACRATSVVITPSVGAPNDGCAVHYSCGAAELDVECDGENDGTGTSLCTCKRNGSEERGVGSLFRGEGIDTCARVAAKCLDQ